MMKIGIFDVLEKTILIHVPIVIGKNLNLMVAVEARCFYPGAKLGQGDTSFSHQLSVVKDVPCRRSPITDVEGQQAASLAAAVDLSL
jgi:hypothetical protein